MEGDSWPVLPQKVHPTLRSREGQGVSQTGEDLKPGGGFQLAALFIYPAALNGPGLSRMVQV